MPEAAVLHDQETRATHPVTSPTVAVIWIDWYAYHVARFRGLLSSIVAGGGTATGIELVGGVGVHTGLKFREDLPSGLPIETLMPHSSWQQAGQLRLAIKLWTRLSSLNPSVVLVPGYYTLPALAAALWAKLHRRLSVLMTESTAGDHSRSGWKEQAKSLLIRLLFDRAITGGSAHQRYLVQLGFPAGRIASSYDVVDNNFFWDARLTLRQRSAAFYGLPETYFLYVGRLAPEKNVSGLLTSWVAYRNAGGTWPLVIVGDGPSSSHLRRMAAQSGFANQIHFEGHKASAELPLYYSFAGCFVLPSTREPWGLVVNEAMAAALPVIVSSRCGCAEDLVAEGNNGFVFNPFNLDQLTGRLMDIASIGPEELRAMGNLSLQRIKQFSPASFGQQVLSLCPPIPTA